MEFVAQFIERNLDESCLEAVSNLILRDKLRGGRDTSGSYENLRINIGRLGAACYNNLVISTHSGRIQQA
jgi:hypothetical protein